MPWNWELPDWPNFRYDRSLVEQKERQFLLQCGSSFAYLKNIGEQDYLQFIVEILSSEGLGSSKIEGEILDRESLQSSIKRHFGLKTPIKPNRKSEQMAELLCSVYDSFERPLSHEMLCNWHLNLFNHQSSLDDVGKYRSHAEPMQIISHRYDSPVVFFEAPPSNKIQEEMSAFVNWFNATEGKESFLGRAALAHVYFESIHPFEDGNGRIGRVLIEKVLSQSVKRPLLIAVSQMLEKRKKEYYSALERCNRTLQINHFVEFLSDAILQAQEESIQLLNFLIAKSKMFTSLSGQLNLRQEKALSRMFEEGPNGFKGGLSAEKYIAITKASRATATRDLSDLVQKKALIKTGELRHTRYWLNLIS